MATVTLFANIFREKLESQTCSIMQSKMSQKEIDIWNNSILDNIIVVGGFPRDIILNRPITDIDIVINLRELCKLQSMHLNKYHTDYFHSSGSASASDSDNNTNENKNNNSDDCDCIFLKPYLNDKMEQKTDLPEMIEFHESDYLLNGKFWVNILTNHDLFHNKLSVHNMSQQGYISCEIVNTLKYSLGNDFAELDLNGVNVDFVDTFDTQTNHSYNVDTSINDQFQFHLNSQSNRAISNQSSVKQFHSKQRRLSMSGDDINTNKIPESKFDSYKQDNDSVNFFRYSDTYVNAQGRYNSGQIGHRQLGSMVFNAASFNNASNTKDGLIFNIPIFSGKLKDKLSFYDFSMNTLIIFFSDLSDKNKIFINCDERIFDKKLWLNNINIALLISQCNPFDDLLKDKILRVPLPNSELQIIQSHPTTYHFWKIIKWLINLPDFRLSDALKTAHIRDMNENWLNKFYFGGGKNKSHCTEFINQIRLCIYNECKNLQDLRRMFEVMNKYFGFHKKFMSLMNENENEDNNLLKSTFESIFSNLMIINHPFINTIDIILILKQYNYPVDSIVNDMDNTNRNQEEKMLDFELELKRLSTEIQTKNQQIEELEENYDNLITSKLNLLKNANDTIDELRQYIKKLQLSKS